MAGISESDGGRTSVTGVVLCLVTAVRYAGGVVCQKLAPRHCLGRPGHHVRLSLTGTAARLPFAGQLLSQPVRHKIRAGTI